VNDPEARTNDRGSACFPIPWNLFLADLMMMPDKDNVFLAAVRISLLAQADELLLFSISARGVQAKLDTLEQWCAWNLNMIKTIMLIIGKIALPLPVFMLGATTFKIKLEEKYVGVTFRADTRSHGTNGEVLRTSNNGD
jgi:hypothetical protein